MQTRRPDLQIFWNRFIAGAAFLLTALVTMGVEGQAGETRGARAQLKHHEAAAIAQQPIRPASVEAADAQSGDGAGPYSFILPAQAFIDSKAAGVFSASGHDTPALHPQAYKEQARAPPSI